VLEIGCGTGRNLALVHRLWPDAALFGIDISEEMLKSARARLGSRAALGIGDATGFDAASLLGRPQFDRIVMPYCLSMIPAWEGAMTHACTLLARGGSLHIVDFGTMAGLPAMIRQPLQAWLTRFHVTPRAELIGYALHLAASHGLACQTKVGIGGYYQMVTLTRPR
jgi:S-adenosylmethionine-diacylgycerolhomoserine-N-methlytransferase